MTTEEIKELKRQLREAKNDSRYRQGQWTKASNELSDAVCKIRGLEHRAVDMERRLNMALRIAKFVEDSLNGGLTPWDVALDMVRLLKTWCNPPK